MQLMCCCRHACLRVCKNVHRTRMITTQLVCTLRTGLTVTWSELCASQLLDFWLPSDDQLRVPSLARRSCQAWKS